MIDFDTYKSAFAPPGLEGRNALRWEGSENQDLFNTGLQTSYRFLSTPDAQGKLRWGTDFGGYDPFNNSITNQMPPSFDLNGTQRMRVGSGYDEYLSGFQKHGLKAPASLRPEAFGYDDRYGYHVDPNLAKEWGDPFSQLAQANNSPAQGMALVGGAMGLANLAAMGLTGTSFAPTDFQSLFSSLGQNAASQGGALSDLGNLFSGGGGESFNLNQLPDAYTEGRMFAGPVSGSEGDMDLSDFFGDVYEQYTGGFNGDPTDINSFLNGLKGEMLNPVNTAGQSFFPSSVLGTVSGLAGTAGKAAAKSALAKIFSGEGSLDDALKIAGSVAPGLLGALGANQQTGALKEISDRYFGLGQPYRDLLQASYAPGFDINSMPGMQGAIDTASQGVLRNLSAKTGNPFDNPGAQAEAMRYVTNSVSLPQLNQYRNQLGAFGQLGVAPASGADMAGAQASGQGLNAIGYGLSNLLSPESDIESLLAKLGGGLNGMKLNLGTGF